MIQYRYNDGGREAAGFKGKAGDCVVRAVAIASGLPYLQIHEYLDKIQKEHYDRSLLKFEKKVSRLREKGRKVKVVYKSKRSGADSGVSTREKWFDEYMNSIGFTWVPTMKIGQGCKVHLKAGELPMGNLVVNVSKHMVAVIDGVINDTYDCSRLGTRCVYGYYIKL